MSNIESTANIGTLVGHEEKSHSDEGKVCSAVFLVQRQDAGVSKDVFITVTHSLEITDHQLSICVHPAPVSKCWH